MPQDKAGVFKNKFISKFQPHAVLKREKQDGRHGNTPKRFLVRNQNYMNFTVKINVRKILK
jgi:hypothetical protein